MRSILIPAALASLFALAACDNKPAVVAVPAPSPAPSTVVVPGPPGQPGPQGEAGKADQSMQMAQVLIGLGYLLFIGYPAIVAVLNF